MTLLDRIDEVEARVEAQEPSILALLPEPGRFDRLRREARALIERYPAADTRPPLFGLLAGIKDIFHVSGWPTHAGSRLPSDVLQGSEAESVARLKRAGALLLGKTVTTEFAHFQPGPTRNPRRPEHTPGGSSSGSAAAVAAGFCDIALGTQTIGSIIRPASFCGIVGLKPTFGRISTNGVIPLAPSLDHVGCFAPDVETTVRVARVLYETWTDAQAEPQRPALGIPEGPYLERAEAATLEWFDDVCSVLVHAGYTIRRLRVMEDFAAIADRQQTILAAEAARVHAHWFADYGHLYGPKTAELIRRGQSIASAALERALAARDAFRSSMHQTMVQEGIDVWVCPSAPGPAPFGLESTGDPVMNLPWTQAGLPAVSLPAGTDGKGLPLGLQLVGRWNEDERLLASAAILRADARFT